MTTSHRALDVYLSGEPAALKALLVTPQDVKRFPDYSYLSLPIFVDRFDKTLNLTIDNRLIGLHASCKSGSFLEEKRLALEIILPPVPGTFIQGNRWRDGSFRIGYKLEESAKKAADDVKMLLIHICIASMADAAARMASFFQHRDVSRDRLHGDFVPLAA